MGRRSLRVADVVEVLEHGQRAGRYGRSQRASGWIGTRSASTSPRRARRDSNLALGRHLRAGRPSLLECVPSLVRHAGTEPPGTS